MNRLIAALVVLGGLCAAVGSAEAQRAAPVSNEVRRVLEASAETRAVAADGRTATAFVVQFDALTQAAAFGGIVEVPLAPGLTVRAAVEWTGTERGNTFVAGRLLDGLNGEVNLTIVDDTLAGRVIVGGRLFMIRRAANSSVHVAIEIDPQSFPPESQLRVPPPTANQATEQQVLGPQDDTNQVVDLMIVYTPAARAYMGSPDAIQTEMVAAVNNANTALANSGVTHRFRLVYQAEVAYTEPADDIDLLNLTYTNGGSIGAVHALRDAYSADLVTLVVRRAGTCGAGWLMGPGSANGSSAPFGFNVVEVACANADLSLAHEAGHNMGLQHERGQTFSDLPPVFPYAYGYGVTGTGRSVMAYTCPGSVPCSRRTIYSTPLRNFPGTLIPAGTATEDNARALEGTSLAVANFRQSMVTCSYTLSATSFSIGQVGGPGTVGVTTSPGCSWTAVSNNTDFITVTGGVPVSGSGIVSYTTAANAGAPRTGTITIAGQTLTLRQGLLVTANRLSLAFGATNAGGTLTNITSPQAVTVGFIGGSLGWTASTTTPWLRIASGAGTGSGRFTVSAVTAPGLLATGTMTGSVTLTSPNAANAAIAIPVTLTLFASPATTALPFGGFDTPVTGANVDGSIAVTGWALDDIEVTRVEIWRDRVAGETTPPHPGPGLGNGKVYIADAFFVNGARPDIESLTPYSRFPLAYRAGWGYLMLTQGLWNRGNGAYTLYAFAYDRDGHSTSLGSKTINVDNPHAVKPFGGIDTPAYGETVSGSFWNFGWALTPPTCTIGPTQVQMAIDSGTLVPVTYGEPRPDIAAAFPGFNNGAGAGGAYHLDTTTLSNGEHTIGWFVTDSCGRADGMGSRFFTVLNGVGTSSVPAQVGDLKPATVAKAPAGTKDLSASAIAVRRGSDTTIVYPLASGTRLVPIGQSERVEVNLPTNAGAYVGYQVVNGERRALPIGSSLDGAQGVFFWQPGAGFLGAHDLEFVSAASTVRVRALVGTSVQAVIDTPSAGSGAGNGGGNPSGLPVSLPFTIAGWAIDEAAASGTGIDAVHVWAHPANGDSPIFLGVASYGDARPDIGGAFGEQFAGSSFSLAVYQLPQGTYDLVAYPHSSVFGDFRNAQVVRVTIP